MSASIATLKSVRRLPAEVSAVDATRSGRSADLVTPMQNVRLPRKPRAKRVAKSGSVVEPSGAPVRYGLRSTVRYRVEGRALTGIVVGVALDEPPRYDVRRLPGANGKRRPAARVSFGVPHGDIEELLALPPDDRSLIVLSDLPPEPRASIGQEASSSARRSFLAQLLGRHGPG